MENETSCINSMAILDYLKEHNVDCSCLFGDLDPEIDSLEDLEKFLRDPNNWISCGVISKLYKRAKLILHDDKAAYKMGKYASENISLGYAQRIVFKSFWSVRKTLKNAQKINDQFNRNKKVELIELKQNEAIVRLHWNSEMEVTKDICLYNQGVYTSLPLVWGGSPLTLKEKCCYFNGAPYCEYHLKWPFKNKFYETFSRFFTTKSVLMDTIKEMEIDKKIIEQKTDKLKNEIEERKQAEAALRESEEKFRKLTELLPETIYEMDVNGILVFVNRRAFEHFGYTEQDFEKGLNGFDMFIPEDRQRAMENAQRILQGEKVGLTEYTALRKDGSTFSAMFHSTPIFREGKPVGLKGVVIDITKHKLAEEELQKLASVVKYSSELINLATLDGKMIFLNKAGSKMLGIDSDKVEQVNIMEVIPDDLREIVQTELLPALMEGDTWEGELKYRNIKTGEVRDVHAMTFTVKEPNTKKPLFLANVSLDITERKRAVEEKAKLEAQLQQAQKMESMGTLAGGIAHDFNNLLMGIQGRTSMMLMDSDSSHSHFEHLKGIEDYVKSAADLTKQLLGFARGGKYEIKPTDLNEFIKKQNRMFGRTRKEINIRGRYEKNLWATEIDQGQIEQVLLNLYVNSWQAMPGGGNLYIQTENIVIDESFNRPYHVEPGQYVKISVTDTGAGMDKATQQRIFDPFFTTKEMGRGTGLGLASAYGIIKNHGGFIDVYSEEGEGSTFNIYLPASEKEIVKEKKILEEVLKGTETVLFVDDEDMIIDVGQDILKSLGYEVLPAMGGEEAVEVYKKNQDKIDMVILDMIMPDMGGGQTYDRLKEINHDIKVLLSSGYSIDGEATNILERGCNGFIQKPFYMTGLSKKIREILDKE